MDLENMPTLTIQLPGLPSVEHIVREDAITLGRMKGNSIALSDSSVSLSHAKITRLGNDFFLKDLNSTNGTMLNGQSITEARLRDGDQLKFGEVIAYFRLEPVAAPTPVPVPVSAPAPALPPVPAPMPVVAPISSATVPSSPPPPSPPRPTAQSVSTPLTTAPTPVAASAPANPAMLPAATPPLRPYAPLPTTPRKNSRGLASVIFGGAGVMVALSVVGFLAWKFFTVDSEPAPPPNPDAPVAAAPNATPAKGIAAAKPAPVPAAALDPNLAELMQALKSTVVAERRKAASAIYNLGSAAQPVLATLSEVLTDADPEVRMWAALALVHNNVQNKATIPIMVQSLQHDNPTLRQVACLSLAMISLTDAEKSLVIPALTDVATNDANPDVSDDALTALKIIAPELQVGK